MRKRTKTDRLHLSELKVKSFVTMINSTLARGGNEFGSNISGEGGDICPISHNAKCPTNSEETDGMDQDG